ncbi:MAG TPA: DUF3124 domain-containing protein [Draconibacterium sp.]|nr:DUF3124 domain-containing protein [Draconibacterium sp.]
MKYSAIISFLLFLLFAGGCRTENSETDLRKSYPSHKYSYVDISASDLNYLETDYVPVYSDIYFQDGTRRFKLTATVSIRNTSMVDSAYVLQATYYDSYGNVLSEYLNSTLLLSPLESIEFVVEEDEQAGGAGANFIVKWGATNYSDQMLIQSVMISTFGQQGMSFMSDSKVIERIHNKP